MRKHEEQKAAGVTPSRSGIKADAPWLQRALESARPAQPPARARRRALDNEVPPAPRTPPPRRRAGVLYLSPEERQVADAMPPPPVPAQPAAQFAANAELRAGEPEVIQATTAEPAPSAPGYPAPEVAVSEAAPQGDQLQRQADDHPAGSVPAASAGLQTVASPPDQAAAPAEPRPAPVEPPPTAALSQLPETTSDTLLEGAGEEVAPPAVAPAAGSAAAVAMAAAEAPPYSSDRVIFERGSAPTIQRQSAGQGAVSEEYMVAGQAFGEPVQATQAAPIPAPEDSPAPSPTTATRLGVDLESPAATLPVTESAVVEHAPAPPGIQRASLQSPAASPADLPGSALGESPPAGSPTDRPTIVTPEAGQPAPPTTAGETSQPSRPETGAGPFASAGPIPQATTAAAIAAAIQRAEQPPASRPRTTGAPVISAPPTIQRLTEATASPPPSAPFSPPAAGTMPVTRAFAAAAPEFGATALGPSPAGSLYVPAVEPPAPQVARSAAAGDLPYRSPSAVVTPAPYVAPLADTPSVWYDAPEIQREAFSETVLPYPIRAQSGPFVTPYAPDIQAAATAPPSTGYPPGIADQRFAAPYEPPVAGTIAPATPSTPSPETMSAPTTESTPQTSAISRHLAATTAAAATVMRRAEQGAHAQPPAAPPALTASQASPEAAAAAQVPVEPPTAQEPDAPGGPLQPLPLEAVLRRTQRGADYELTDLSVTETPEPGEPLLQREPEQGEAVRQAMSQVTTGQQTRAGVELVLPRRARPTPAVPADGDGLTATLQRATDTESAGPYLVDTEIGPLPSDLWTLIGSTPPPVAGQPDGAPAASQAAIQRSPADADAVAAAIAAAEAPGPRADTSPRPAGAGHVDVQPAAAPELVAPAEPIFVQRSAADVVMLGRDGGGESGSGPTTVVTAAGESVSAEQSEPQVDMHELARKVYDEIRRRLAADRERSRS